MGIVAYLGVDHHMLNLNKTDTTCQQVNLGMVVYLGACRPCMRVPDIVIIFLCVAKVT